MEPKKSFFESRKYRRHKPNGNAMVAFFTAAHEFLSLGQILDISLGGLAIRYIAMDEQTKGSAKLEIFGAIDSDLHIGKLPCRVIYDIELTSESSGLLRVRRCGVQFGELSNVQMSQIREFISTYGVKENHSGQDIRKIQGRVASAL